MNWSFVIFSFCLAVATGAIAVTVLARMRPQWTTRKQGLVAASVLPAIGLLVMLAGVVNLIASEQVSGGMQDLALAAIVRAGVITATIGFVGGLLGAALRQKGMRR